MSQDVKLARFVFDAELKVLKHWQVGRFKTHYALEKTSEFEICPRCAVRSSRSSRYLSLYSDIRFLISGSDLISDI